MADRITSKDEEHMQEHAELDQGVQELYKRQAQLFKNDLYQLWMGLAIFVLLLIHLALTLWEIFT